MKKVLTIAALLTAPLLLNACQSSDMEHEGKMMKDDAMTQENKMMHDDMKKDGMMMDDKKMMKKDGMM